MSVKSISNKSNTATQTSEVLLKVDTTTITVRTITVDLAVQAALAVKVSEDKAHKDLEVLVHKSLVVQVAKDSVVQILKNSAGQVAKDSVVQTLRNSGAKV